MVKSTNAHAGHIVPMTDSLDCRLNSSLQLQHLCTWEMMCPSKCCLVDLDTVPGFFFPAAIADMLSNTPVVVGGGIFLFVP